MHNTAKYVSRLVVFLFKIIFDMFGEWGVSGLVSLHDFSRRFVDNNYVIVFVYYFHVKRGVKRYDV